jgi:hypothetical protein
MCQALPLRPLADELFGLGFSSMLPLPVAADTDWASAAEFSVIVNG